MHAIVRQVRRTGAAAAVAAVVRAAVVDAAADAVRCDTPFVALLAGTVTSSADQTGDLDSAADGSSYLQAWAWDHTSSFQTSGRGSDSALASASASLPVAWRTGTACCPSWERQVLESGWGVILVVPTAGLVQRCICRRQGCLLMAV